VIEEKVLGIGKIRTLFAKKERKGNVWLRN
jgi:hypothetical protein